MLVLLVEVKVADLGLDSPAQMQKKSRLPLQLAFCWSIQSRTQPAMVVVCKMEVQLKYTHIAYLFFARLAPICMLSRVPIIKISASELSRKFIKSALLVGDERMRLSSLSEGIKVPCGLVVDGCGQGHTSHPTPKTTTYSVSSLWVVTQILGHKRAKE